MNAPSPLTGANALVSLAVSVNGQPLPDAALLLSVEIDHALGAAPISRVTVRSVDTMVSVGEWIEIRAGYDGNLRSLFFGKVSAVQFAAEASDGATLSFVCTGDFPTTPTDAPPVLTLTYGADVMAARIANATANDARATTGTVKFQGSALVLPGDNVALAGFPALFCGAVPVCCVMHAFAEGNWTTTLELGPARAAAPAEITLADANGNSLRLDAQGISLRSAGAITVNGLSVNLAAQTELVARGGTSAEISASGETVVRGAMVRIN